MKISFPVFSTSFIVLAVTTLIHLELVFVCGDVGVWLPWFARGRPVVPALGAEETLLSPLRGLGPQVKNHLTASGKFVTRLGFSSVVVFFQVYTPHRVGYCCFVGSFQTGNCESSNFVVLFQARVGFLGSLAIPYGF